MCQTVFRGTTADIGNGGGSEHNWKEPSKELRGRTTQREGRRWQMRLPRGGGGGGCALRGPAAGYGPHARAAASH